MRQTAFSPERQSNNYSACDYCMHFMSAGILSAFFSTAGTGSQQQMAALADFAATLTEINKSLRAIGEFISGIHTFFSIIAQYIRIEIVVLLIVILFISQGLHLVGVPRGKLSFLLSLLAADVLWFLLKKSLNPGSYQFIQSMIIANGYLLLPFLFILGIKKIAPWINTSIKTFLLYKTPLVKNKRVTKEEIIPLLEHFQEKSLEFQKSILRDVTDANDREIYITANTLSALAELEKIIRTLQSSARKGTHGRTANLEPCQYHEKDPD